MDFGILGATKTREDGNNKHCREYYVWTGMLTRCYDENYLKLKPTYIGCKTSDNFKEYSFFYKWCSKQIGFNSLDDKGKSFALVLKPSKKSAINFIGAWIILAMSISISPTSMTSR